MIFKLFSGRIQGMSNEKIAGAIIRTHRLMGKRETGENPVRSRHCKQGAHNHSLETATDSI